MRKKKLQERYDKIVELWNRKDLSEEEKKEKMNELLNNAQK